MKLAEAVKAEIWKRRRAGMKQYKLAKAAEIGPVVLSQLLHDALNVQVGDERVRRLALLLGVEPEACLVEDRTE